MTGMPAYASQTVLRLIGRRLPDVALPATDGTQVNLARLDGLSVIYAYPRTSPPDGTSVPGWSEMPGAKGCTPQSCGFRDHFAELHELGVAHVFGVSTQTTAYQQEAVARLHLPFALLSDAALTLQKALDLPVFEASGMTLLHRVTLITRDGEIERVFHSITDPSTNAADVIATFTKA